MNKTIIININGIVFHIEEDAYEVLKTYMTEVKRHFAYSADSIEIVTDIENRLAEMFSERLSEHKKQVIVLADVEDITSQMGKASDFDTDESDTSFDSAKFKTGRTLYKDTDDKMIAGVCAGLAHYLDMEVKWVRILAVMFIFASGASIIAYLILWAVLPMAISRQEKLAMRGEPLNLQTFKRSFDEDVQEGTPLLSTNLKNDPIQGVVNLLIKLIKILGGILSVAIGLFIVVALAALIFGLGILSKSEFQHFPFNVIDPEFMSPVLFSAFLIIFIPLIALMLLCIRIVFNYKIVSRYGAFSMLILWLTGLGIGGYYAAQIASEFTEEAKIEQSSELKSHPKLWLKLNQTVFFSKDDSVQFNIREGKFKGRILFDRKNMGESMQNVELYIDKSVDDKFLLVKELSGKGSNFENALKAAQRINYQFLQKDSVIEFNKYLTLKGKGLYRHQVVIVRLKVPVNTKLVIERNLNWHLHNLNLWDCTSGDKHDKKPSEWIMTDTGLKCADSTTVEKPTYN